MSAVSVFRSQLELLLCSGIWINKHVNKLLGDLNERRYHSS